MLCYVNIYHKNFLFVGLLKVLILYYCIVSYRMYIVVFPGQVPLVAGVCVLLYMIAMG